MVYWELKRHGSVDDRDVYLHETETNLGKLHMITYRTNTGSLAKRIFIDEPDEADKFFVSTMGEILAGKI